MTRPLRLLAWTCVAVALLASLASLASPSAAQDARTGAAASRTLVVHVPSSPVESPAAQAAALETLAATLTAAVEGFTLEPQLFRRHADAESFLDASPEQAVLVLSDAAWVPGLVERGWQPVFRLRRAGAVTYRQVLVVPSSSSAESLADLAGASLTVVETGAAGAHLRRTIFGGEVEPAELFSEVLTEADDVGAVNAVLFGRSDAALVAEYNPLLAQNLAQNLADDGGHELRVIYRSPELSLPVLSLRADAVDGASRAAIERTLLSLSSGALASLGFDSFVALDAGQRSALVRVPEPVEVRYEISAPDSGALRLEPPPAPPSEALPYRLAIELPRVDVEESLPRSSGSGNQTP